MQEIRTVMEEAHAVTKWNKGDRKALQRTSELRVWDTELLTCNLRKSGAPLVDPLIHQLNKQHTPFSAFNIRAKQLIFIFLIYLLVREKI